MLIVVADVYYPGSASLKSLDISNNPISDDGISLLIEGLKGNKVLTNFSSDDCQITTKGINLAIHFLTLIYYDAKHTGACCIAEFLKNNQPLNTLSVCYNNIGDDGVSMIVEALQGNNTITEFMVDDCGISVKGIVHCLYAIVLCMRAHTCHYK